MVALAILVGCPRMGNPGAREHVPQQSAYGTVTPVFSGHGTMKKPDKLLESDFFENGPPRCCELLRILFAEDEQSANPAGDPLQGGPDREDDALRDTDKSRNEKEQEAL